MTAVALYLLLGIALCPALGRRLPSLGTCLAAGMAVYVLIATAVAAALLPSITVNILVWCATPLAAVAVWHRRSTWGNQLRRQLDTSQLSPRSMPILAAVVGLWLLIAFCYMGLPPANYDVLSYHIPNAVEFASEDRGARMFFHPETFYERLPLAGAIIASKAAPTYEASFGLGLPILVVASILGGLSSLLRVSRLLGVRRRGRIIVALAWLFHGLVLGALANLQNDVIVALMTIAALEFALNASAGRGRPAAALFAGALGGTAAAIKLSAVGVALVPVALVFAGRLLGAEWRGKKAPVMLPRRLVLLAACFGIGVLIALGPWALRATIVGGHPMYPFRGESKGWSQSQADFVVSVHSPRDLLDWRSYPSIVRASRSLGHGIPFVGWSLIFLAILLIPTHTRRPTPLLLAAAAILGWLAWSSLAGNPGRFLLPAIVLALPLLGLLAGPGRSRRTGESLCLAFVIFLALGLIPLTYEAVTMEKSYRREARREVLAKRLGSPLMDVVDRAVASADGGAIGLIFEARPTLIGPNAVYSTVWDTPWWLSLVKGAVSEDEALGRLRAEGIEGVLVNEFEWDRLVMFYGARWRGGRSDSVAPSSLRVTGESEALTGYPPVALSGLTAQERDLLASLLRRLRRGAIAAAPLDSIVQIWYAPIPEAP